jgi:phosphoglycerate dehydrogenase-like enzyme
MTKIVIEKDHFLQVMPVILDPATPDEHQQAWVNFFSHDVPDFLGWCRTLQGRLPGLFPATVTFAEDQEDLRRQIVDADGVIVESLRIDEAELAVAKRLAFVQRFGSVTSNIDVPACARHGVTVDIIRRRVNIAVAEQAFMLMIALAKRVGEFNKVVRAADLAQAGYPLRPYDTRYSGSSNYARIPGLGTLNGSTFGVIGMGEVGREIASRAAAFGMSVLYTQRNRIHPSDEWPSRATYCSIEELVSRSDYISINLPLTPATRGIYGKKLFDATKAGAVLVNVARAGLIDRESLMEALETGRLGGLGLDVGYEEPAREDEPLLNYPNVIYMPHTAIGDRHLALWDLEEMCLKMWRGLNSTRRL